MIKTQQNGLIEDLYVTGSHAILKKRLSEKEEWKMTKLLDTIGGDIDYNVEIDGMKKLVACFDEEFEEFNEEIYYNIYHLVLEHDNVFQNYGIYANGLLTESTDELTLNRMSDFTIINSGHITQHKTIRPFQNNSRILTKIVNLNARARIYIYDKDAVMLKEKYIDDEKERKENKTLVSIKTNTYKKRSSSNETYNHAYTYRQMKN